MHRAYRRHGAEFGCTQLYITTAAATEALPITGLTRTQDRQVLRTYRRDPRPGNAGSNTVDEHVPLARRSWLVWPKSPDSRGGCPYVLRQGVEPDFF